MSDTERLLTELDAFTTDDNGALILAKARAYLRGCSWREVSGDPQVLMRDGVVVTLPSQTKTRADLLQIARALEIVATFETRYRVDVWRDVLKISLKPLPPSVVWANG